MPTTYGNDIVYCLKSHCGVRGYCRQKWVLQVQIICKFSNERTCKRNKDVQGLSCGFEAYEKIYCGKWLNDKPYGVIHRLVSNGTTHGITKTCIEWCLKQIQNIRIDTHADNKIMQSLMLKYGFEYCGIIHTHNGTERLAYQITEG